MAEELTEPADVGDAVAKMVSDVVVVEVRGVVEAAAEVERKRIARMAERLSKEANAMAAIEGVDRRHFEETALAYRLFAMQLLMGAEEQEGAAEGDAPAAEERAAEQARAEEREEIAATLDDAADWLDREEPSELSAPSEVAHALRGHAAAIRGRGEEGGS